MSFFDLLITRRSIRRYTDQKVEPEKIQKITAAALMSPSSKRSTPWEFVVVEDPEMLQKLSECRPHSSELLAKAPLGIVVAANTARSNVWVVDASIAAIIMQLEAHDLGLDSCWINVHDRQKDEDLSSEEYIRGLLNIPEEYGVLCVLSIGYKAEERKPHIVDELHYEKVHYGKF